jgi:hypothetical protein
MNSLNNPIETPAVDPMGTNMVESDPNVNTNFSAALAGRPSLFVEGANGPFR